jgi:signal transduction histidine kinase/CheY-like chemotaxis protein
MCDPPQVVLRDVAEKLATEADLRTSISNAEDLATQKASFLAFVCHEIRNPVHGLLGVSAQMQDATKTETLSEEMQLYILNMKYNVDVMATIVDDILDLNVLRGMGQLALRSRPFMVDAAAAAVEGVLGSILDGSGKTDVIEHSCTCSDELLKLTPHGLEGDGARVLQIMFNLTSNAARMTITGSISVRLDVDESTETTQEHAPTPAADSDAVARANGSLRWGSHTSTPQPEAEVKMLRLRITVTDTGPGLDPAHIPVLLEQFSSAKSEIIQKSGGTGLGLPLIKSVVDAMGGTMQFDCAAGRPGVSVVIVLPLIVVDKPAEETLNAPAAVGHHLSSTALRNSQLSKWVYGCPKQGSAASSPPSRHSHSLQRTNSADPVHDAKDGYRYSSSSCSPHDQTHSVSVRYHTKTTLRQLLLIKAAASEIKVTQLSPSIAPEHIRRRAHSVTSGKRSPSSSRMSSLSRGEVKRRSVNAPGDGTSSSHTRQSVGEIGPALGLEHFMVQWKEKNRVLVVDDVKLNCLLLRKYTEQGGYKGTLVADNGYKALHIMEKDWKEHEEGSLGPRVSIVLMDCNMPVMDGYVATRKIREFNPDVAIFAVTGNAMPSQMQKCFDCGMDALVLKPFDKPTIVSRLDGYVRSLYDVGLSTHPDPQHREPGTAEDTLAGICVPADQESTAVGLSSGADCTPE